MSRRTIIIIIIIFVVILGGWIGSKVNKSSTPNFVVAKRGDVVEIVSVTGQVKATEAVDLAFERGGKVSGVSVKVGDAVKGGQILASLSNADFAAQVAQASANLAAEQARLLELQKGTREEDLHIASVRVASAAKTVQDAEKNLANVIAKADTDLHAAKESALTAALDATTSAKNALLTLTDIQFVHFAGMIDQQDFVIERAKADAVFYLLGAPDAGRYTNILISTLSGGVYGRVQDALLNQNSTDIPALLADGFFALQKVAYALDQIQITPYLTTTEKTNLSAEKTNVNLDIAALSAKKQAVVTQIILNDSAILAAQTSLNTARNNLDSATADWQLKKAGATPEQIAAQQARAKAAAAQVQSAQAEIAKTVIRSPYEGIVTKTDGSPGEIIPANKAVVSMIADAQFEIEAYVPEADITKVKVNDPSQVTLDAYTSDVVFETRVSAIDPAETVINGVNNYRIILQFAHLDPRIRSGMTANIDITTKRVENVINVPQRAVRSKDGAKYIQVLKDDKVEEVEVETGLRGSDGTLEIKSGISEKEKVVI